MFKKLILIYLTRLTHEEVLEVVIRCLSYLWQENRDDLIDEIRVDCLNARDEED